MPESRFERVAGGVYLTLGVGWLAVLLWERLDPDGPRDLWRRIVELRDQRRAYQEAMSRTLADIDSLPEKQR